MSEVIDKDGRIEFRLDIQDKELYFLWCQRNNTKPSEDLRAYVLRRIQSVKKDVIP